MVRSARLLLVAFVVSLLASSAPSFAAAQTALPPSLQGETFFASERLLGHVVDINTAACTGSTQTLTVHAEGGAAGPYPGRFVEDVTVTFNPGATLFAPTVTLDARFTIQSPVGTVTGRKTLTRGQTHCGVALGFEQLGRIAYTDARVTYEATIKPATGGTFTDSGTAELVAFHACATSACAAPVGVFSEQFTLSTGVLPVDTSGKATGGGQVISGSSLFQRVTFGFNVRKSEDERRLEGTCNVVDHATGTHVKCLTVTDYQQVGNTATWEGTARVNGVVEEYRITVQDNGEPNQGIDTFSINTESYEAAGNVTHGNVQLHKQELVDTP